MDKDCSDQSKVHKECVIQDGARSKLFDDSHGRTLNKPLEAQSPSAPIVNLSVDAVLAGFLARRSPAADVKQAQSDVAPAAPGDQVVTAGSSEKKAQAKWLELSGGPRAPEIIAPASAPPQALDVKPSPSAHIDKPIVSYGPEGQSADARTYDVRALTLDNHAWTQKNSHRPNTPDAMVAMPRDFDPSKPINLVVYNHGFGNSANSALNSAHLAEQMKNAPPNTVLVVPEWQAYPGTSSYDDGNFGKANGFNKMLQECFSKTPELAGKTLGDVAAVSVIAHSAGHLPAEAELYNNGNYRTKDGQIHQGISEKINRLNLLDANYTGHAFDSWLENNLTDLAKGKKQFGNIYHGTRKNSEAQEQRLLTMLQKKGLDRSLVYSDVANPDSVMTSQQMKHSMFFKYTTARQGKLGPHGSLPYLYFGRIES